MNKPITTKSFNACLLALAGMVSVAGSLALAGCSRQDQQDAKITTDQAVAEVKQGAHEMTAQASRGLDQAKVAAAGMAKDAKQAGKEAGDKLGDKVSDAVITTGVKAEMAKDPNLSALQVNVDTEAGKVVLQGTAPSTESREKATTLARSVKGVVSVQNDLTIDRGVK